MSTPTDTSSSSSSSDQQGGAAGVPPPGGVAVVPPPPAVDANVVVQPGGFEVERSTSSGPTGSGVATGSGVDLSWDAMHSALSGSAGDDANQEQVMRDGRRSPGGTHQPLTAQERLMEENRYLMDLVRRNGQRINDLLREQEGVAVVPLPQNLVTGEQAAPVGGRPEQAAAVGGRPNLWNQNSSSPILAPPHLANNPGGNAEVIVARNPQRRHEVFQELRGKVDDEKENFANTYSTQHSTSIQQLIIKSTRERLMKLKNEYMHSHQTLLATRPSKEQKEEWSRQLIEGLQYIEEATNDLSEKMKNLGLEENEGSLNCTSNSSMSQNGPVRYHGPRMPEMRMTSFDGEVSEFLQWEQLFENLVGQRTDLNGAAKMSYLLGAVGPKVSKLISRLALSTAGYNAARKLLTKKYGRADLLVASEITTLTSSPKAPEGESSDWETSMQDAVTFAQRIRDTVERLANKEELGDIFLQIIIKEKMPLWMFTRYDLKLREDGQKSGREDGELTWLEKTEHLLEFIEQRLATSMSVGQRHSTTGYNKNAKKMLQTEKIEKPVKITTTAAFATGVTGVNGAGARSCVFCDKSGHKNESCPTLKSITPQDASKICQEKKVCKRCLKAGHVGAECRSGLTCTKCNKDNHHTVLHFPTKE